MARDRIVSPGVFTREHDLSFLPQQIAAIGAAVIGPTQYGPAFVPTVLSTYEDYIRTFGLSFTSGSTDVEQEYKYLTNYTAKEYLKWGENLTVMRVLNGEYAEAWSNVVSSGSWNRFSGSVGDYSSPASSDTTASIFTDSDASVKLTLLSPGEFANTGQEFASTNGVGNLEDETTKGILDSGSRVAYRWEIRDTNVKRGTFDLYIRRSDDRHGRKIIVERYNDLSLDPNDSKYIERVIGNQVMTLRYDSDLRPFLQVSGSYPNRSRILRAEALKRTLNYLDVNGNVTNAGASGSLPQECSGTFANGSDGYKKHPVMYFDKITETNSQGFNLAEGATPSGSGMTLDGDPTAVTTAGGAGYIAYRDAIDILSNQDEYDINMLMLPGVIDGFNGHSDVYTYAEAMVETRGDVFLVIDPTQYGGTIGEAELAAEGRDTSYAAMYYPWVQVADPDLQRNVWIPPSCMVAGVIAFNDYVKYPWYAPAGLNRGILDNAIQTERKLTHADRDRLYVSNINPIATFPRDGISIWGQKTLQKKRSALDRVNVRRLLIDAKKFIASTVKYLVFEQNTVETRLKFIQITAPYFRDVMSKQGLYDFKIIIDESNNTPDVIDRNEMRAQIHLKPTRTAEFIIVDFFIHPTGATFPGD